MKDQAQVAGLLNFWGVLSDTVMIVFGVERSATDPKEHPRISLRDMEAAYEVAQFITRQYPQKLVSLVAAGTPGWQNMLQHDTSLIIVGGFVTNSAFASYHHLFSNIYSLRRGRLCGLEYQLDRVKERRVFHVRFKDIEGIEVPPRSDPQAIDSAPSELVARDYGLVTSHQITLNERSRRVISIAGIKGYGTLGAAKTLTGKIDQPDSINQVISSPLRKGDSLEMIIAADVGDNRIDRTEFVEVIINNQRKYRSKKQGWELCELGWPCEGCKFGLRTRM